MATSPSDGFSEKGLSSWIWSSIRGSKGPHTKDNNKDDHSSNEETNEVRHRKQLAQILRYIATMHHSLGSSDNNKRGSNGHSFLKRSTNLQRCWQSSFYQQESKTVSTDEERRCGVLFTTQNFKSLLRIQAESSTVLFENPPFSFYAATSSGQASTEANRKRAWADAFRTAAGSQQNNSGNNNDEKACWLRLTRLTTEMPEPPSLCNPAVRRYLEQWRELNSDEFEHCRSFRDMLTLGTIDRAPKINPAELSRTQEIKSFLRSYKRYLRKKAFQQALEPIYNQLFEWVQQTQYEQTELVWGLGHARMIASDNTVVNGPLLEVLMEVELARDGALLVRPREHTGVALNREVVTALMNVSLDDSASVASAASATTAASGNQRLMQMHRTVAELDPLQISPGQPTTYVPLLKRMVVELSSTGCFQMSTKLSAAADSQPPEPFKMLITEAWCLYSRPKPSSVWARDAMAFADQLLLPPSSGTANFDLPKATWALTLGPGALEDPALITDNKNKVHSGARDGFVARLMSGRYLSNGNKTKEEENDDKNLLNESPIVFPLPTSDAQNRIADLLLRQDYPAIVTEGPPGTGKTHTIVNMISAYLCQGKRVLVTSKSAPALSVIRSRLPKCVQDLVVDVSMSELAGMRQLQQTVERLANRVSCVSTAMETEKCIMLLRNLRALEEERASIDDKLVAASDRIRCLILQPNGQKLVSEMLSLNEDAHWLTKTTAKWTVEKLVDFKGRLESTTALFDDRMSRVFHGCYATPPTPNLISAVAAKAGMILPAMKEATKKAFASMLGQVFTSRSDSVREQEQLDAITVDGEAPKTKEDWQLVLQTLRFEAAIDKLHQTELGPLIQDEAWPERELYARSGQKKQQRSIRGAFLETLDRLLDLKKLANTLNIPEEIERARDFRALDARRGLIASQIQRLAEELVDAKVITELSRSFSAEAQSALIRFSQIAGKAKFSRASQPSKMTVRQRRHRQEYLDAFDRCVRYIPCWIMTSSQISDYLPAECLFDLVIIDEASQSDITVLPGLLRGRKWLVVGDGKQVSPTESFISEESIDSLRAALPRCPLEDSLLPGQSFFDLCAQAFPRGRVVLREHFRCAPNIINFSNQQFYDGRLIPLRLPTSTERLTPSIIDIRIPDGVKIGKVNEKECDEIVRLIHAFVTDAATIFSACPRTIGIISLLGDDQSRLIRGRLLDRVGAHKFKEHDILIGDPPTFQGAERDIVFLSMVCSPGSVPTQNRLMHAQRINVALSRARDRMVLVRSVDTQHIPNNEDIKINVIEFFEAAAKLNNGPIVDSGRARRMDSPTSSFRERAEALLESFLKKRGFSCQSMGIVWDSAICVEHPGSDARAALCIENCGEAKDRWERTRTQQKSIERVGWKCLRVDGVSFLMDPNDTMDVVLDFLAVAGVEAPPVVYDSLDYEEGTKSEGSELVAEVAEDMEEDMQVDENIENENAGRELEGDANDGVVDIVVISSEDENEEESGNVAGYLPDMVTSHIEAALANDQMDAAQFGHVVQLDFLRGGEISSPSMDDSSILENVPVVNVARFPVHTMSSRMPRTTSRRSLHVEENLGDQSDVEGDANDRLNSGQQNAADKAQDEASPFGKRRKSSHKRKGRYPGRSTTQNTKDDGAQLQDTDSDIAVDSVGEDGDYEQSDDL